MKSRTWASFAALAVWGCLMGGQALAAVGAPQEWQIGMPESASNIASHMNSFNNLLLVIIVSIVVFVMALLAYVAVRYRESANPVPSKTSHNTTIEVLWTIVPVLILVVIAIPSFRLLYEQFSFPKADVTVKVTGRPGWFWTYEYPDSKISFDSHMIEDSDLKPGQLRNLSVDEEMVVPVNKVVQVLITSDSVIHQWVVPAFGSRADAIPGRVNRTWFRPTETGVFYGQCSALCGDRHAFMPIAVRVVSDEDYRAWLDNKSKTASAAATKVAMQPNGELAR